MASSWPTAKGGAPGDQQRGGGMQGRGRGKQKDVKKGRGKGGRGGTKTCQACGVHGVVSKRHMSGCPYKDCSCPSCEHLTESSYAKL